jgi:hypothetical protein
VTTPAHLLDAEVRRDGSRPFITGYDSQGGRVELSVVTTANWVAKTSGYLEDEIGIEPGDELSVAPTLHWLTAVVLLAAWAVGAEVRTDGSAGTTVDVPLDPMGMAFNRLVAAYPDQRPAAPFPAGSDAVRAAPDLPPGARVLTTLPLDGAGLGLGLLGPLAAGGSAVYAADGADASAIARTERVTHTAGVDVPGLPRLG